MREQSYYVEIDSVVFDVYGNYESGCPGDDLTPPMAQSFEVTKVKYKDVDITKALDVFNVDLKIVENKVLEQYQD
jgi:hypothetical protein